MFAHLSGVLFDPRRLQIGFDVLKNGGIRIQQVLIALDKETLRVCGIERLTYYTVEEFLTQLAFHLILKLISSSPW